MILSWLILLCLGDKFRDGLDLTPVILNHEGDESSFVSYKYGSLKI